MEGKTGKMISRAKRWEDMLKTFNKNCMFFLCAGRSMVFVRRRKWGMKTRCVAWHGLRHGAVYRHGVGAQFYSLETIGVASPASSLSSAFASAVN